MCLKLLAILDLARLKRRVEARLGKSACKNLFEEAKKNDADAAPSGAAQSERRPFTRTLKTRKGEWFVVG